MIKARESEVRMVPLEQITVVNPRERGNRKFKQIVDNIARLGLKKPITITPKKQSGGSDEYFLVCGQGRYEAFKVLEETHIPALVVHVSKVKLLLMSLVENLARRRHSTIELIRDISDMRERGDTFNQIALKTDLDVSYVRGMIKLLKKGEERLIQAVERGQVPISVAITIASSDDHEVQKALTEAYERNVLRGNRLLAARRLVEKRKTDGKSTRGSKRSGSARMSTDKLLRTYQEETTKQRLLLQKAKICEARLTFLESALRQLFADSAFVTLLREESLDTLPAFLSSRIQEGSS